MSNLRSQQYICPNCFAQRSINDVYFRTGTRNGDQDLDLCQTKLACRLQQDGREPRSVTGWKLARWQEYPAAQRILDDEVVVGLRDYNGDELRVRVCPVCHYPLPSVSSQPVLLLPWDADGLAYPRAGALFHTLSRAAVQVDSGAGGSDPDGSDQADRQGSAPYAGPSGQFQGGMSPTEQIRSHVSRTAFRWETWVSGYDGDNAAMAYTQLNTPYGVLGYPAGLPRRKSSASEQIRHNYYRRANASALWLELEPEDPMTTGGNGDARAIWTMERFLEETERAEDTFRPTVFFLRLPQGEGPEDQFQRVLQDKHKNFCIALQTHFYCFLVLPWKEDPDIASQAVQWMMTGGGGANDAQPAQAPLGDIPGNG